MKESIMNKNIMSIILKFKVKKHLKILKMSYQKELSERHLNVFKMIYDVFVILF